MNIGIYINGKDMVRILLNPKPWGRKPDGGRVINTGKAYCYSAHHEGTCFWHSFLLTFLIHPHPCETGLETRISTPDADVISLENEIDRVVYSLYGLTTEETAIVEASE